MFNLQGSEIIVILLLALVVLGPEKLPEAIRKFTQTYSELKKMGTGFQSELKSALDEPMREMRETAELVKNAANPDMLTKQAEDDAVKRAAADAATAVGAAASMPAAADDHDGGTDVDTDESKAVNPAAFLVADPSYEVDSSEPSIPADDTPIDGTLTPHVLEDDEPIDHIATASSTTTIEPCGDETMSGEPTPDASVLDDSAPVREEPRPSEPVFNSVAPNQTPTSMSTMADEPEDANAP